MDYEKDLTNDVYEDIVCGEDEEEYKVKVVGVTFNNDDGSSRQKILQKIKDKEPPFNGNVHYSLFVYTYNYRPAVAVLANGMMIGTVPKEHADYIAEHISKVKRVYVGVYGGGLKQNGRRKSLGASTTLIIDTKATAAQPEMPQYNAAAYNPQPSAPNTNFIQYEMPQYSVPTFESQPYSVANTLTRSDRYLRAILWCVCSCGALFPVSIYQLYKSMHLPKKDSVTHQLSYEWSKMDCYIAAALWFILSFGFGFPVSIYYIYKSFEVEDDKKLDEIKNQFRSIWEKVKGKFK